LRAGHDALREAIWRQTSGVLRRRRVVRRGFVLLALAGCYAAGLLTTGALRAPQQSVQIVAYHSIQQTPAPAPPRREAESAVALEWQAFDSTAGRAELYRKAGDHYLADLDDVRSAARCYRLALDASP